LREQDELECVARPGYVHEYWNLVYTTERVYVSSGGRGSSDYYGQSSYGDLKKRASRKQGRNLVRVMKKSDIFKKKIGFLKKKRFCVVVL